jgi:hypothetical protein
MRLTSLILVLLSFSSCASYQYVTLNSPEMPKNDKKELAWENDTMRLIYNFHGQGGPISMTVFNKMDKPLFVNWKKSALIRDGQAFSLFDSKVQISGGYSGSSVGGRSFQLSSGSYSGSFDLPEGMNLIPPGSYITRSLQAIVQLSPLVSTKFTDKEQPVQQRMVAYSGTSYTFRTYSFDQSASPLHFSSYFTFVVANSTQEFSVSHSFYAQQVMLSGEAPEFFGYYKPEGDKLYLRVPAQ